MGNGVRMYTPSTGKEWREEITKQAEAAAWSGPTLDGPMQVTITVLLARPKSHLNAKGEVKANAPKHPLNMRSGDVDNYAKSVMDMITGKIWTDDAQVVVLVVGKAYSPDVDRTEVEITCLE